MKFSPSHFLICHPQPSSSLSFGDLIPGVNVPVCLIIWTVGIYLKVSVTTRSMCLLLYFFFCPLLIAGRCWFIPAKKPIPPSSIEVAKLSCRAELKAPAPGPGKATLVSALRSCQDCKMALRRPARSVWDHRWLWSISDESTAGSFHLSALRMDQLIAELGTKLWKGRTTKCICRSFLEAQQEPLLGFLVEAKDSAPKYLPSQSVAPQTYLEKRYCRDCRTQRPASSQCCLRKETTSCSPPPNTE